MQESTQTRIEELKVRATQRESARYPKAFKAEAVNLVAELRQKGWSQTRICKELEIPWATLKRWASKIARTPQKSGGFRAVEVVDSPAAPVLISPSGWRIEGLSVHELVALAGRL